MPVRRGTKGGEKKPKNPKNPKKPKNPKNPKNPKKPEAEEPEAEKNLFTVKDRLNFLTGRVPPMKACVGKECGNITVFSRARLKKFVVKKNADTGRELLDKLEYELSHCVACIKRRDRKARNTDREERRKEKESYYQEHGEDNYPNVSEDEATEDEREDEIE